MTTHSSILDWEFHRQEPGGLQSLGSQRIGHGWATNTFSFSLQNCEKISFCCLSHQVYGTWLQQPQETNTSGSGHPPGCQSCGCLGRWVPLPLTRKTKTALPCNPTTTLAVFSYSCSLSFCSLPRILTQAHAWALWVFVLFQGFWHKPMHGALGQKPSPLIPPQRTIQTS